MSQMYVHYVSYTFSVSVGQVQNKECYFLFPYTFQAFFIAFHHKICIFIIFIIFFDKVSNFLNTLLTNQKQELMIKSFEWNCMLIKNTRDNTMTILLNNYLPQHLKNFIQHNTFYLLYE